MKILIDLQHPAHLHFFRPLVKRLQAEGHRVKITGRDKDILVELAEASGLDVEVFGTAKKGVVNLGCELLYRQRKLWKIIGAFKPDVMLAIAGTFISSLGWLRRIPTFVFYDTEHATISNLLAYPFCRCVYVPQCYRKKIRSRHVRYPGYHELAYLHPDYFTPDPKVLDEIGVGEQELFSIVRLVGWGAAHDVGLTGFSAGNKRRAVEELAKFGKVFISSEDPLPEDLEPYRLKVGVARMHDVMAHAALIFGESATMCSEGAVMGVPGIYVDPVGRGYTDEQERDYGLVFNFTSENQDQAIAKIPDVLEGYDRSAWQAKGEQLRSDKVDVTAMMHDIVMERP